MPNSKQAAKRMRQNEERRARNKSDRTAMKTAVKKVLQAGTSEEARTRLPEAMKRVDKAAKKNVIHKNTAARIKSRITTAAAAK
jgi:small subunit ribosomal protein S20